MCIYSRSSSHNDIFITGTFKSHNEQTLWKEIQVKINVLIILASIDHCHIFLVSVDVWKYFFFFLLIVLFSSFLCWQ